MISFDDVEKANDSILANADAYASARANKNQLENYLKIKEASLMSTADGAVEIRRAKARAHPEYIAIVNALRDTERTEHKLLWIKHHAQNTIDIWRTQQASSRGGV